MRDVAEKIFNGMFWILIIFSVIACYGLKRKNESLSRAVVDLHAEVSVLAYSLDECETGSTVYREALLEATEPSPRIEWALDYERWEESRTENEKTELSSLSSGLSSVP